MTASHCTPVDSDSDAEPEARDRLPLASESASERGGRKVAAVPVTEWRRVQVATTRRARTAWENIDVPARGRRPLPGFRATEAPQLRRLLFKFQVASLNIDMQLPPPFLVPSLKSQHRHATAPLRRQPRRTLPVLRLQCHREPWSCRPTTLRPTADTLSGRGNAGTLSRAYV